jgi:hypothetical protein
MPNLQGQYRATRQQDVAPAPERQCRELDTWPNGADFDPAILHDWRDHEASMIALAQRWAATARGEKASPPDQGARTHH